MKYAAIVFITVGIVMLAYVWKTDSFYMPKLEPWPTLKGRVLETKLITTSENEETGQSTFKPVVKYEFKYSDRIFRENRIFPKEQEFDSRKKAQQFLEQFPQNKEIDVYFNTDLGKSPRSVLIWELPDTPHPLVGIAVACIVLGMIALLVIVGRYVKNQFST